VAIDWGVYGVPETFVVDARGFIRYKYVGPVTDDVYQNILKPLLAELRK
jgi:cytochrome c biogenesis protein CcmG/thiol:disulfide interchange protein DsbE